MNALILYSFELSRWGWLFITERCRRGHVHGSCMILYKFCALVGVCGLSL